MGKRLSNDELLWARENMLNLTDRYLEEFALEAPLLFNARLKYFIHAFKSFSGTANSIGFIIHQASIDNI